MAAGIQPLPVKPSVIRSVTNDFKSTLEGFRSARTTILPKMFFAFEEMVQRNTMEFISAAVSHVLNLPNDTQFVSDATPPKGSLRVLPIGGIFFYCSLDSLPRFDVAKQMITQAV